MAARRKPDLSERAATEWRAVGLSMFDGALPELESIDRELARLTAATAQRSHPRPLNRPIGRLLGRPSFDGLWRGPPPPLRVGG